MSQFPFILKKWLLLFYNVTFLDNDVKDDEKFITISNNINKSSYVIINILAMDNKLNKNILYLIDILQNIIKKLQIKEIYLISICLNMINRSMYNPIKRLKISLLPPLSLNNFKSITKNVNETPMLMSLLHSHLINDAVKVFQLDPKCLFSYCLLSLNQNNNTISIKLLKDLFYDIILSYENFYKKNIEISQTGYEFIEEIFSECLYFFTNYSLNNSIDHIHISKTLSNTILNYAYKFLYKYSIVLIFSLCIQLHCKYQTHLIDFTKYNRYSIDYGDFNILFNLLYTLLEDIFCGNIPICINFDDICYELFSECSFMSLLSSNRDMIMKRKSTKFFAEIDHDASSDDNITIETDCSKDFTFTIYIELKQLKYFKTRCYILKLLFQCIEYLLNIISTLKLNSIVSDLLKNKLEEYINKYNQSINDDSFINLDNILFWYSSALIILDKLGIIKNHNDSLIEIMVEDNNIYKNKLLISDIITSYYI